MKFFDLLPWSWADQAKAGHFGNLRPIWRDAALQYNPLTPGRCAQAKPAVAYLMIVNIRVIDLHRQAKNGR
jgi:hypothetical protein